MLSFVFALLNNEQALLLTLGIQEWTLKIFYEFLPLELADSE